MAFVLFCVPFAGCIAAESSDTRASNSIAPAAVPTAAADTGSIAGKTVDEEQLPIEGVGVVIAETRNSTKSDASGRFTFNDLQPGTYTVLTGRAGFKEQAKKVDVVPGEITEATIVLMEIALPAEWVQVDRQSQGMIAGSYVAVYPNDLQSWNKKWYLKDDPAVLEGMQIEADWLPSTALGNGIRFWSAIPAWNSEKTLCVGSGFDPYVCVVPPEKYKVDWGCDHASEPNSCIAQWQFRPGGSSGTQGLVGLWPQDTVTVYVSHFFRMPMPAEYKARA
ncbi:MAG: carboxypeptidase-like regulatory domain-containing protein [Euryarchaeota archaeon]|nr:carboxypeptidase-like regulatory domain-containing protein [Euryarchaeota archaeon]